MLSGQVLHLPHEAQQARVGDRQLLLLARLGAVSQHQFAPGDVQMPPPQGGGAETLVGGGIMFIAHAQLGEVEQADDGGDGAVLAQAALGQIAVETRPQLGQGAAEIGAAGIFLRLARGAEIGVVAILLASPVVIAGRLDMAEGRGAEPAVAISGRQGNGVQPVDLVPVRDARAIAIIISPAPLECAPRDAGMSVVRMNECGLGHVFLLMPQNPPFIASFRNSVRGSAVHRVPPSEGEIYARH